MTFHPPDAAHRRAFLIVIVIVAWTLLGSACASALAGDRLKELQTANVASKDAKASRPDRPFALFVEAGDVDFALHKNNLDNAVGALFSGEEAVRGIIDWIEKNSNWDDSVLVVSADHGHYLVLDDPSALVAPK